MNYLPIILIVFVILSSICTETNYNDSTTDQRPSMQGLIGVVTQHYLL